MALDDIPLEMLRARARYTLTISAHEEIDAALGAVCDRIEAGFEPGAAADDRALADVLAGIRRRDLGKHYSHHLEAVRLFVGSELDTETPGERGLGRMTVGTWPRLGGAYRRQLDERAKQRVGPVVEEAVIAGFVVGAGLSPLRDGGPYELRWRPLNEAMNRWLPTLTQGYDPDSYTCGRLVDSATDAIERLVELGRELGMIGRLRRGRQEAQLATIAVLYVSAGIALFDTATSRWDGDRLRVQASTGQRV